MTMDESFMRAFGRKSTLRRHASKPRGCSLMAKARAARPCEEQQDEPGDELAGQAAGHEGEHHADDAAHL